MKVYSKIVISLDTGEVLEEVSREHVGEVALCKGGGGGQSGEIGWPDYLEEMHEQVLDKLWGVIEATTNPYHGLVPYDPAVETANIGTALSDFETKIDTYNPASWWIPVIEAAANTYDTYVDDDDSHLEDVTAFGDLLTADIENDTLPRFRAGMRTVNAVQSSAFVIGEACIESERVRTLAKYSTETKLKMKSNREALIMQLANQVVNTEMQVVQHYHELAHLKIEGNRIKIVANKEQKDVELDLAKKKARWDFEEIQYMSNLLAGPSGGTMGHPDTPSALQSAIGGALSGASAGFMMGGGVPGAFIGGALGLGASLLG